MTRNKKTKGVQTNFIGRLQASLQNESDWTPRRHWTPERQWTSEQV